MSKRFRFETDSGLSPGLSPGLSIGRRPASVCSPAVRSVSGSAPSSPVSSSSASGRGSTKRSRGPTRRWRRPFRGRDATDAIVESARNRRKCARRWTSAIPAYGPEAPGRGEGGMTGRPPTLAETAVRAGVSGGARRRLRVVRSVVAVLRRARRGGDDPPRHFATRGDGQVLRDHGDPCALDADVGEHAVVEPR